MISTILFLNACGAGGSSFGGTISSTGNFRCCDGTYSNASHRQGVCSYHGGICDSSSSSSSGSGSSNGGGSGNNNSNQYYYTYHSMILADIEDGDTYKFYYNGNTITCRVNGIDTPESIETAKLNRISSRCNIPVADIQDAGVEAKHFVENYLIIGHSYNVSLIGTDQYSRNVCKISYNGDFFGKKVVQYGYAVVLEQYLTHNNEKNEYNNLESYSKSYNLGLWNTDRQLMECLTSQ